MGGPPLPPLPSLPPLPPLPIADALSFAEADGEEEEEGSARFGRAQLASCSAMAAAKAPCGGGRSVVGVAQPDVVAVERVGVAVHLAAHPPRERQHREGRVRVPQGQALIVVQFIHLCPIYPSTRRNRSVQQKCLCSQA